MASINSYGLGQEYRDGGRWSHSSAGSRPAQQASSTLSSYKGGEGVNVDDDSDCDRGENGSGAPRSAAQRAKDRAQQQQQQQSKGGAKVAAAKGKRKLREKRRGTGVVHLPTNDQSTGDSLDDDDDDDGGTKVNTSSNETSAVSNNEPTPPSTAYRTSAGSSISSGMNDPAPEHMSKFGQRVLSSSGYGRSWQQEMATAAMVAASEPAATGGRLHGDSPGKDDYSAGSSLRSCLKGTAGAAKDASAPRRPVTSLVSRFEQNKPAPPSANGNGSAMPSAGVAGGAARSAREEGAPMHASAQTQFRGPKEEEASRVGMAPAATVMLQRTPGDGVGPVAGATASTTSVRQLSGTTGLGTRSATNAALPTAPLPQQPTRGPILPPWKQQPDAGGAAPAAAVTVAAGAGGPAGGASARVTPSTAGTTVASAGISSVVSSAASRAMSASDDHASPSAGTAPARLLSDPHRRPNVSEERVSASAVDDLLRKNADLQKVVDHLQADNGQLHKLLVEREREVERLKHDMQVKDAHIAELNSTIASLDQDLEELDHDNINLAEENEALRKAVATLSLS